MITDTRIDGRSLIIEYNYDANIPSVSQDTLQEFATDLHIKDFESSTTHWAVKKVGIVSPPVRT
jgi:hypothetical protein